MWPYLEKKNDFVNVLQDLKMKSSHIGVGPKTNARCHEGRGGAEDVHTKEKLTWGERQRCVYWQVSVEDWQQLP